MDRNVLPKLLPRPGARHRLQSMQNNDDGSSERGEGFSEPQEKPVGGSSGNEPKSLSPETLPVRRRPIRWWPAIAILTLSLLGSVALCFIPHRSQQHLNIHLAEAFIVTGGALLLWLLLGSRLRWTVRLSVFAGVVLAGVAVAALLKIRGVTGNLVPILEFRWSSRELRTTLVAKARKDPVIVPGVVDFPQFLGPNRNGILTSPRLATNWTTWPPTPLWKQPIGAAWSGFVVSGSLAITQEQRGEEELTVAYDLLTGQTVWSHAVKTRYFTTLAGEGPRATPSIAGRKVLVQGATGVLACLDLENGKTIWTKDIFQDNQCQMPGWGQSSSPLVLDDLVIVGPGGKQERSIVAYRLNDGARVWGGGSEESTYSSPLAVTLGGVRQIIVFSNSLIGHDAATGQELWRFHWPGGHPHIAMPIVVDDSSLIISSGYGTGSGRVKIQRDASGKWSASSVWRVNRLKAKFANPVLHRGNVYGLDDGILACLNAETGEPRWKDGRYGHGQTFLVGDLLLVMTENGSIVLVDPQPDGLHELTSFSALTGKCWNPPALAGEYLLVRNDKEAACYRMPMR